MVILSDVKRSGTKSKKPVELPLGFSAGSLDFAAAPLGMTAN
jgi:hypothetical protein